MGVVLHAEDTRLGRQVALKFLPGLRPVDPAAAERVRHEARSLAALQHANIVTIYDIDEVGAPFLVMEWVPGRSLGSAALATPVSADAYLRIALPVAEALAAAHSHGITHRDIKPGNVLLTEEGGAKLVDFGIAKFRTGHPNLTVTGSLVGTLRYTSPEQVTGGDVGPSSDVFSFGVLSYELLAGRPPFDGDSPAAVLHAIAHTPHVPLARHRPDLPSDVVAIVERCLQNDPGQRYPNGSELAVDLHSALHGSIAAQPRTPLGTPRAPGTLPEAKRGSRPEIRYCRTEDSQSIAFATNGAGPPLIRVLGWMTHVEMEWDWPALRLIWELLGRSHSVVRFDGRGIGLSSPWTGEFSEEARQMDLDAVARATGAETVALFGISEGGWTAASYALRNPDRVSHLIVYGGYARGAKHRPGYDPVESPPEREAMLTLMRRGWGRDTPEIRQMFTTYYFGEDAAPGLVAHYNRLQRAATDGETAARYQNSLWKRGDAREEFSRIRVPTLVLHCRDDRVVSFEEGRILAATIPGARFQPLPSVSHYFPVDDDVTYEIADAITRFTGSG